MRGAERPPLWRRLASSPTPRRRRRRRTFRPAAGGAKVGGGGGSSASAPDRRSLILCEPASATVARLSRRLERPATGDGATLAARKRQPWRPGDPRRRLLGRADFPRAGKLPRLGR